MLCKYIAGAAEYLVGLQCLASTYVKYCSADQREYAGEGFLAREEWKAIIQGVG